MVHYKFKKGDTEDYFIGIGALEAKIAKLQTEFFLKHNKNLFGKFEAIKLGNAEYTQLEDIREELPYSFLLLYDPIHFLGKCVPIYFPGALGTNSRLLLESSWHLSEQVCYRWLQGYDLNLQKEKIKLVLEKSKDLKPPRWVVVTGVGYDTEPSPQEKIIELTEKKENKEQGAFKELFNEFGEEPNEKNEPEQDLGPDSPGPS